MKKFTNKFVKKHTSWENVAPWYNKLVGETGQYFHKQIIIPKTLRLLNLQKDASVLDLGCGQGIFARYIPKTCNYTGIDISPTLLDYARKQLQNPKFHFTVADITKPLSIVKKDFNVCLLLLVLQNIKDIGSVIANANKHLRQGGKLLIVLNHPCFRIPRQSRWGIDENSKLQYRIINRYLSPLAIPIDMTPGRTTKKEVTWSFHYPISMYSQILYKNGFCINQIEEWTSDKTSIGKAAKMENRSRKEFPLFLAILAKKAINNE